MSPTGNQTDVGQKRLKVVYRWRRITDPNTPFVVVLRSFEPDDSVPHRQLVELSKDF